MRRAALGGVETEFELKGTGRGGDVAEEVWRARGAGWVDHTSRTHCWSTVEEGDWRGVSGGDAVSWRRAHVRRSMMQRVRRGG
jgi:hypothetical protein